MSRAPLLDLRVDRWQVSGSENGVPLHSLVGAPCAGGAAATCFSWAQPQQPPLLRRAAGGCPLAVLCDITNTGLGCPGGGEKVASVGSISFSRARPAACPTGEAPRTAAGELRVPALAWGGSSCTSLATPAAATAARAAPLPQPAPPPLVSEPAHDDAMDTEEEANAEDPQSVAEYAQDIYRHLGREEPGLLPRPDYMEAQPSINAKMRAILVDWLVEVHTKYRLKTETLFLTVNLIDRFLEKRQMARKRLQLVGVTSMLIAAKFEEIYPPEVRDFVYITDSAYTKEDILKMEVCMLTALKFVLCCPTVAHFLERYRRVNRCVEAHHHHLMQYVLELTLPDLKMIRYAPSHLAAAAALLSNKLLKQQPHWPASMIRHTKQTEPMIKGCAREMCGLLEAAERSPLQAVRRKFSQPKYGAVAKLAF